MIDAIEIDFFQSHKGTVVSLGPGVNVVTGTSDSGKSAIIRALVWLIQNRPQGVGFRSTFADKADATRVGLSFADGAWVVRERDALKLNQYRIEGMEMEALRADVPTEVQTLLNLQDYNVQGQHDAYFLLQNTPGEVARMLNDVVGLDVIDAVLKEVNSIVVDSHREAERAGSEVEWLKGAIEEFKFLKDIEKNVQKVDELTLERDERRAAVATLTTLARDLELADRSVRECEAWLAVEGELARVEKGAEDVRQLKWEHGELARIVEELVDAQYKLGRHEAILALQEKAREIGRTNDERKKLDGIVKEILGVAGEVETRSVTIEALEGEERELLSKVTTCPVCKTERLDREARDNVIEYFQRMEGKQRL